MATVPERPAPVAASRMPEMLAEACAQCRVRPADLLDWALSDGWLSIILPDGREVRFAVQQGGKKKRPRG